MTSLAPSSGVGNDVSYLFDHNGHVLRTRMSAALGEIGLTPRMHCVLVHALEEERTQNQLAEIGDMDKTTMVVTVDALERAGLAERRPSSKDRRARVIAVTEEGAKTAARSQRIVDSVHAEVLDALPEDEREVFLRALHRLADGLLAEPVAATTARRTRERTL
ncbi:MarR family transcriptional regulator [Actinomadura logoneensis]|uniref:MarR family transcriptional regulator n=1 Tax=Actinomadura logoneensis TaxID=2293572 RepID=A0A372JRD5_9ACTN|nr:MarR family winged helix-turn-helix transcriptional regulator [Actinomadura logoneensis]RFU42520.1 MarR family transcriptional regulator [Actinomadura logoneensis]